MHCDFTPEIKLDCIKDIISMIRQGDLAREDVLLIVEHVSCFLGSGAKMLRGVPGPVGAIDTDLDLHTLADSLESVLPAEDAVAAIPWLEIAKILIPLLLLILKEEN